ncbi:hypothetical protein EMQ25_14080 [Arsenicitalea aurantiaca]|uniref:Uncharacterized protein n=1 Tax=Arsenicitalea aurantiaca TaxID=1783274 RepID=A0A433X5A9_9HYPH|nr:hypothetical protein [Arsenicitalea aurantiaca]RUT29253.1 hypothetical protein EMQ25_14080 [Arsenicitalea aurantiaca]
MPDTVPTSDQLRDHIDKGGSSDKVAYPDPAAAPLGTDDEAAGKSPSREERRMAAGAEIAAPQVRRSAHIDPTLLYFGMAALVMLAALFMIGLGRT